MPKKPAQVPTDPGAESSKIVREVLEDLRKRLQSDGVFDPSTLIRLEGVIASGKLKRSKDVEQAIRGD